MTTKRYVVVWHEANDSGVPTDTMGSSPVFKSRKEAQDWLKDTIDEDRDRHRESKRKGGFREDDIGENVFRTIGNGQTCHYRIEELKFEDAAADCVEEIGKILTAHMYPNAAKEALGYIRAHQNEWLPVREWVVGVNFSPASSVHHVKAHSPEEAEQLVNDMIDARTLVLSEEQKSEMMDNLLENVESVKVVGWEDE